MHKQPFFRLCPLLATVLAWPRTIVSMGLGVLITVCSLPSHGQPNGAFWSDLPAQAQRNAMANVSRPMPIAYRGVSINLNALYGLARTPRARPNQAGLQLTLPHPDGTTRDYVVWASNVMAPELAKKFPKMITLSGHALKNPSEILQLDVTPRGLSAQILSPEGRWLIDPLSPSTPETSISYRADQVKSRHDSNQCLVTTGAQQEALELKKKAVETEAQRAVPQRSVGTSLRTYRLAVTTTGEYATYHGGTVQSALAAVVTTTARVSQIYQKELSVAFQLVANNDQLIYTNAATDPFSNTSNDIDVSTGVIDSKIGNASYDIGHLMGTGDGGLASLGVICNSSLKGAGITGSPQPVGDAFDVDYVAHEIGHQFAGNHTFNGATGGCSGGNRNALTAFEPGSGSTIQAYAGICGPDNLQSASDPMFHSVSFDEMIAHVEDGSGSQCGTLAATGNTAPSVNAGSDYTVPAKTPLLLTGTASDSEQSNLTYSWEQRDLGSQSLLTAVDDGFIPLFRALEPVASPTRYLPQLSSVVAGASSNQEKIPQVSRTMDFRLTVRDGAGGVNSDDVVINVDGNSGPFALTIPNGGESIGNTATVTWSPAGTTGTPVSTAQVEFYLSTNGGASFDIGPFGATDNDGSAIVTMPSSVSSTTARLMIRGKDNIFYDVSDANFAITTAVGTTPADPIVWSTQAGDSLATIYFEAGSGDAATSFRAACTPSGQPVDVSVGSSPNASIPDNNPTGIIDIINISDVVTLPSSGPNVSVNISHEWRGDLTLVLQSPSGTSVTLKSPSADSTPNLVGAYPTTLTPVESLAGFSGEATSGSWQLRVADIYPQDTGTLNSWGMAFTPVGLGSVQAEAAGAPITLTGLTNGASYSCSLIALNNTIESSTVYAGAVTPTASAVVGKPTITDIETSSGSITVQIAAGAGAGATATGYRAICNGLVKDSSTRAITFSGLTDGNDVSCVAVALSSGGGSEPSAVSIVTVGEEDVQSGLPIWLLYEASK